MYLTDDEKRMLDGEQGEIKQRCMQFLVAYGEAASAERLVDLDGTVDMHPGQFWVPDYAISAEEIDELANRGEKFKVPTFANKATAPGFIYDGWENCGTMPDSAPGYREKCLAPFKSWIKMGMIRRSRVTVTWWLPICPRSASTPHGLRARLSPG